jgi:large conductance mechanosensitive channel
MKGFKEFLLRGNVIDLAVAVVVGAAFTGVVNSLVNSVLNPAIGAIFNSSSLSSLWVVSIPTVSGKPAEIGFGAVVAAVIQFVLVAVVVYFALIVPINFLKKRAFKEKEQGAPAPEVPSEVDVLVEIRDLLRELRPEGTHVALGGAAEKQIATPDNGQARP